MALETATNPTTGERVALINNEWKPFSETATNPTTKEKLALIDNEWQSLGISEEAPAAKDSPVAADKPKTEEEPGFGSREWFAQGLLGRTATGIGQRVAHAMLTPEQQKYMDEQGQDELTKLGQSAKQGMSRLMSEPGAVASEVGAGLKEMGKQAIEHPIDTAVGLVKEIIRDPEFLFMGGAGAKLGANVTKNLGTAAAIAGKTLIAGAEGGALMGGMEAIAQTAEKKPYDPVALGVATTLGGVAGGVLHGVKEGYKGITERNKVLDEHLKSRDSTQPDIKPGDTDLGVSPPDLIKTEKTPYSKTKIRPDETVSEVLKRKREREVAESLIRDEQQAAQDQIDVNPPLASDGSMSKATYDKYVAAKDRIAEREAKVAADAEASAVRFKDSDALAVTDKNNNIHLNTPAIAQDFADGFKYIFEPSVPSGFQKQKVFEILGVTRDQLKQLIPDVETYEKFLKAHEESHVINNDRASYPRKEGGGADLEHPDALAIETRATADALSSLEKSPTKGIELDIKAEDGVHPTVKSAIGIVKDALRNIRAEIRLATIWENTITKEVPVEGIRTRMTRALEAERPYDRLLTDKEKAETLAGMSKGIDNYQTKIREAQARGDLVEEKLLIEKLDRLTFVRDRLANLPSEEFAIPLLKQIEIRLRATGEAAKKEGLVDGLLRNYVTHVLDFSKSKLGPMAQKDFLESIFGAPKDSKLVKDFTAHRVYTTLRELEKLVEGTGITVLTDIAKIVNAYEKSIQTARINKSAIDYFSTHASPDGRMFMVPASELPSHRGYVPFTGKGTKPLENWVVHPDLVDPLKFMFRQSDPSLVLRSLGAIGHLTKALNTIGSLFHAYSLATAHAMASPVNFIKEVFSAGAGIRKAVDNFKNNENHELIDGFIRDGLVAETEDIQRTIIAKTGEAVDKLLRKYGPFELERGLVTKVTDPFDRQVLHRLNTFTWDYMHTGQKLNLAMTMFAKAKLKNPEIADATLRKEISSFINNTFGGLDWLEAADQASNKYWRAFAMKAAGIEGREWAQVLLFAPDWTVSTLRAFTTALPKELSKPKNWKLREGIEGLYNPTTQGDFARRYVLTTAITYLTIANGINMALVGRPIWENKDPTRIDLPDGTSMQPAKHSMETAEWLLHPFKTLGNKLGFIPKAAIIATTGVAYPSPDAPKLKDSSAVGRAKAIALTALPFQVGAAISAPKGEGTRRAVMSTIGMPIYGRPDAAHTPNDIKKEAELERHRVRVEKKQKIKEDRNK